MSAKTRSAEPLTLKVTHSAAGLRRCLLFIPMLVSFSCHKPESTSAPEVTVQAVHPRLGSVSETITADAILSPLAQAAISPKVTAPVKKFYVQRGTQVKAGELLATLENSDLAAAALDNKGAYTAAQGRLSDSDPGHCAGRLFQGRVGCYPGQGES